MKHIDFDPELEQEEQPRTIKIDARFKEIYYQTPPEPIKESMQALQHRHEVWNYMMHISMQNSIAQFIKKSECV